MPENTTFFVILAALSVAVLTRWVTPQDFRELGWKPIALAAALFWSILAIFLTMFFWDDYYGFFAEPIQRFLIPLAAFIIYPLWSLLLRWLSLRLPGNPVAAFSLLGGLQALPEHAIAIYGVHILDIPLMQGSAPLSIFVFAYFEYVVYWSLVLASARLLRRILKWR